MPDLIAEFSGPYFALSNFSLHEVFYDGFWFPTAEHAFQAAKTTDYQRRWFIGLSATPKEAKRLGRQVELRQDWEDVKFQVMRSILLWKFHWSQDARNVLRNTGDAELIEGNTWHDNVWGTCYCGRPACEAPGRNLLGKLLMEVRNA